MPTPKRDRNPSSKNNCSSDPGYWDAPPQTNHQPLSQGKSLKLQKTLPKMIESKDVKIDLAIKSFASGSAQLEKPGERNETFAYERYKYYKAKVLSAYHERKIFTIRGNYPQIRASLLQRGWLEKLGIDELTSLQNLSQHRLLKYAADGNEYERMATSKMLDRFPIYFIWQFKNTPDPTDYTMPYRNRIKRAKMLDFCTKEGLLSCIESSHWSTIEGVAQTFAPKTHRLCTKEEIDEFEEDYRLTQCISLLTFINEQCNPEDVFCLTGTISINSLQFAIRQVDLVIMLKRNEDIDLNLLEVGSASDYEWRVFIENAEKIIKDRKVFMAPKEETVRHMATVRRTLINAKKIWPSISMDGYMNIWIVKPYNKCRAYGIALMTDYNKIISFARKNFQLRYIVQKYIERPLLIYNAKFDIRQYFLITHKDAVHIWTYKDCYLRFSSQEFSLTDLREAIHLTNNSVQSKYNNGIRDPLLPKENMWTLNDFLQYLIKINRGYMWTDRIYPKMKENIISVILSSLEAMEVIPNTFELYGCDFMITSNYEPVLIEINATPDMSPTTSITAKICPKALEDTIKVVVDLPHNPAASTGDFELIYSIPYTKRPNYAQGLVVQGRSIKLLQLRKSLSDKSRIKIIESNEMKRSVSQIQRSKKRPGKRQIKNNEIGFGNCKNITIIQNC